MGFHCHTQCKVACFTVYNLCWKKTKTVVTACNTRLSMWINLILILHSLWAVAANKCWGQPRLPSSVVQVRYYRFTKQTSVVWVVAYPRCSCLGLTCCNCAQDCMRCKNRWVVSTIQWLPQLQGQWLCTTAKTDLYLRRHSSCLQTSEDTLITLRCKENLQHNVINVSLLAGQCE